MKLPRKNQSWSQLLEVSTDDVQWYAISVWSNRDLAPIPKERQTWGFLSYCGFWAVGGSCLTAWTLGATMLSYGLNAPESIGAVIAGSTFIGILSVLCGWLGRTQHVGFTVHARCMYGMRGSYFAIILRALVSCFWWGIQAIWGGQATKAVLGALSPSFLTGSMNTLLSNYSGMLKNDFIGLIVWCVIYCAVQYVPPERLQTTFSISFALLTSTCIGILIWALITAGGIGPLFTSRAMVSPDPDIYPTLGWSMIFGITSIVGSWTSGCLGQSDWSRYSKTKSSPILSQLLGAPLSITLTALIGIIVTSCSQTIFGEIIWNPIILLPRIQLHYNSSAGSRAAVFFASVAFAFSQMTLNVVVNAYPTGIDLAALWPRYINMRRGAYLMSAVGLLTQPWVLISSASVFVKVLSGFGVFMAPMTGILLGDLVIRRNKYKIDDLYLGTPDSIYWYYHGFNWRAFVSLCLGPAPLFPGFVSAVGNLHIAAPWARMYNMTFILGTSISCLSYLLICWAWPPVGLGLSSDFKDSASIALTNDETKTSEYRETTALNFVESVDSGLTQQSGHLI